VQTEEAFNQEEATQISKKGTAVLVFGEEKETGKGGNLEKIQKTPR